MLAELRHTEPDLEAIRVAAAAYEGGVLGLHASPSLFGGAKAVVVEDFDEGGEELQADLDAKQAELDAITPPPPPGPGGDVE